MQRGFGLKCRTDEKNEELRSVFSGFRKRCFPAKFAVYTDLREGEGYFVGYTGKLWVPGTWRGGGTTQNPAGQPDNDRLLKPPTTAVCRRTCRTCRASRGRVATIPPSGPSTTSRFLLPRNAGDSIEPLLSRLHEPEQIDVSDALRCAGFVHDNLHAPGALFQLHSVMFEKLES